MLMLKFIKYINTPSSVTYLVDNLKNPTNYYNYYQDYFTEDKYVKLKKWINVIFEAVYTLKVWYDTFLIVPKWEDYEENQRKKKTFFNISKEDFNKVLDQFHNWKVKTIQEAWKIYFSSKFMLQKKGKAVFLTLIEDYNE